MKRSNSFSIKTLIAKAYFITSVILFCNLSSVAQQSSQVNFKNGSIAYHGVDGEELVVSLKIENDIQRKISVTILDMSGEKIYSRSFSDKTISKKFSIPAGIGSITFVVTDPTERKDHRFKITTDQRYVGEFAVKRVI